MRWPLQPLQRLQKTQLQPPFDPSVDSFCYPWFTTTNLPYRFPILKLPPPPYAVLLVYTHQCNASCSTWNSTDKYGTIRKVPIQGLPWEGNVSNERLPMQSVEVFQWLSSAIPCKSCFCCAACNMVCMRMSFWDQTDEAGELSLFTSMPRGCANSLSFLLQIPGSPNYVGTALWPACLPGCFLTCMGTVQCISRTHGTVGIRPMWCQLWAVTDSHGCQLLNAIAHG